MKNPWIFFCAVVALFLVAGAGAQTVSAAYSSGAGTPDDPPREATAFITDAKAAEAVRDWPGVLSITTRGLAWYPQNPELLCLQGYAFRKTGQYQKAVDSVSRAIQLDPRPVRYANRGYAYLALGNYSAALADAQAGILLDANYTTNYGVRALALQGMGRNAEAQEAISTALAQSPDSAHYWHVKGRILASSGDSSGAVPAFEMSISLDPNYALPWPGFGSARENLAALNSTCIPVTLPASPHTTMQKAPLEGILAAAGTALALLAAGIRK